MIDGLSIIMPVDKDRISLFIKSIQAYKKFGIPENVEFIILSRTITHLDDDLFEGINAHLWSYVHNGPYFNPAKALNLGVIKSKYDHVVITCPEVKPECNIIKLMFELSENNYVFQVFDEYPDGSTHHSLVNSHYRSTDPAMYFFAMFKKKDILKINGWDEDFMKGYAWEDSDYGVRWNNARIPFVTYDDVVLIHQCHPRGGMCEGWSVNHLLFNKHVEMGLIWADNGIMKPGVENYGV